MTSTPLPPDAPPAYARSRLGDRTLAWCRAKGWLRGPRVVERERMAPEIEAALVELRK